MGKIHFLIALHNHQPVGNFDAVFERACNGAYKPFLDELQRHPAIRMTVHYSGSLLEWMERNRPDIIDQVRELIHAGQIEIMGGGYYEPIMAMLPEHDKIGQITTYTEHLQGLFDTTVEGYWLTERVWEQSLTRPLVDAGVTYTIVDDTHFKYAGVKEEDLNSYYVTEDEGRVLRLFSGSEKLRYYIPFDDPWKTTEYLRSINTAPDALMAYADDGEKFGIWPETHEHVYTNGWLRRFFEELENNLDQIDFITFAEAVERLRPRAKIYLPDASYREMTEWALPARAITDYEHTTEQLKECGLYERAKLYMRGGFWRNFKVKYPESDLMYSKMMHVSGKVHEIQESNPEAFARARAELYRGQCNCAYWHGVFGGLYLPHLRHAVYEHLIRAEAIADKASGQELEARECDFDTDGFPETYLANTELTAVIKPDRGGHVVELDVRRKNMNLLAGLSRRFEAYHSYVAVSPADQTQTSRESADAVGTEEAIAVKSIHQIVAVKENGLEKLLHYDWYLHEGFVDHFLLQDADLEDMMNCEFNERGDFVTGRYEHELSESSIAARLELRRSGTVWIDGTAHPVALKKTYALAKHKAELECSYEIISHMPLDIIFGVECSFAFPGTDRALWNYRFEDGRDAGDLEIPYSYEQQGGIGVTDRLKGADVALRYSLPADLWLFPIRTVSQSESGFEGVFQSSVIIARWPLHLAPGEAWRVSVTKAVTDIQG